MQVPVNIKVYTKKSALVPTLYHGYVPYTTFIEVPPDTKKPPEYSVFSVSIDDYPQGIYLDDLRIEMNDNNRMDKVEISYHI